MSTDASFSPDDLLTLQRELAHTQSVLAETAVTCQAQQTRIEQLQAETELLKRYLYGRRSERFVEDSAQGHLFEQPAGLAPGAELPEAAQDRSTMCEILGGAAFLLEPLVALAKRRLLAIDILGADDTPARLLDPSHPQGVRLARFWLYRGSEAAPYNVFDFHESRSRDGPRRFLGDYQGWLKVDAYGVDDGVYLGNSRMRASCCMANARRKFEEALSSYPQLPAEALAYFRQLYDIEDRASPLSPEARQALRQAEAVPLLDRLRSWADSQAEASLPKSTPGKAVGYLRNSGSR